MSNSSLKEDILQFGLQYYRLVGENISYTPRKLYIYRFLNVVILITVLYCIVENCFRQEESLHLIKSIEAMITLFHILIKYILFIYKKNDIKAVIGEKAKFWQPNSEDSKQNKFWKKLRIFAKIQQRVLLIAVIISMGYYMLKPYFNSLDVFPFSVRTHRSTFWMDVVVLAMQYYSIWMVTTAVMTYDMVYFALCIHIIVQLKLLAYKLYEMTDLKQELRLCIEHHQLQSRIFAKLQDIYSWMLMIQYFMCLIMTCIQLYILSTRKIGVADTFELVLYLVSMYSQFGYYSIPVEAIHARFAEVGDAAYASAWYESEAAVQKNVLAMMTYAQNSKYLTGCGIILINVDAFGSVFRKSFSLYLVLKNLI